VNAPARAPRRADGEAKRQHIYDTALRLFRERGFAPTTMRDIAEAAGVSLGSAYHYFTSKEAIVFAYYDETQAQIEALSRKRLRGVTDVAERISIVLHTRIDCVRRDRKLLVAIARSLPDPDDPLSAFSEESRAVRERAIALCREVIEPLELPGPRKESLALALWALHMAGLLYLLYDDSPGQRRTRELIDGVVSLVHPLLFAVESPLAAPLLDQVEAILRRARVLQG
jgi:AcrR family transcriptional regulator